MTKQKQKSGQPSLFDLKVDDYVLMGGTQASYPGHWYLGRVVWLGKTDVLIERNTMNGGRTWREVAAISEIRARGTIADLVRIQDAASKGVRELQKGITEAESALGAARDALFARLDELAKGGLEVIPPDFAKIEADHAEIQQAVEQYDTEEQQRLGK